MISSGEVPDAALERMKNDHIAKAQARVLELAESDEERAERIADEVADDDYKAARDQDTWDAYDRGEIQ